MGRRMAAASPLRRNSLPGGGGAHTAHKEVLSRPENNQTGASVWDMPSLLSSAPEQHDTNSVADDFSACISRKRRRMISAEIAAARVTVNNTARSAVTVGDVRIM